MTVALELQVALQRLFDVLADQQLAQVLQVRQAFQEQDALHQSVGVLHLVDRLVVGVLAQARQSPVIEHPRVQKVLVDRGQLVLEDLVQRLQDDGVALHRVLRTAKGADLEQRALKRQQEKAVRASGGDRAFAGFDVGIDQLTGRVFTLPAAAGDRQIGLYVAQADSTAVDHFADLAIVDRMAHANVHPGLSGDAGWV
jgi:hypothetical protein